MSATRSADATHPVLIVGAGVAGASLALRLARRGIPTVVVERRHDPAPGPAEVLFPSALRHLQGLGLADDDLAAQAIVASVVLHTLHGRHLLPFIDGSGRPEGARVVGRLGVLRALRREATRAGAVWLVGNQAVALIEDGGRVVGAHLRGDDAREWQQPACLVAVATGAAALPLFPSGRRCDLVHGYALSQEFEVEDARTGYRLDLPSPATLPGGGISWSYPSGPRRLVLGVASGAVSSSQAEGALSSAIEAVHRMLCAEVPALSGQAWGPPVGSPIAALYHHEDAARAGVLFLGDALGNPGMLSTNGIGLALDSAAQAYAAIDGSPDVDASYVRAIRIRHGRPLGIGDLTSSPRSAWRVLDAGVATASLLGRAVDRQFRGELDDDDTVDREAQTVKAAQRIGVTPALLSSVRERALDAIHAEFPMLAKLCERLPADPSEPVRAACVYGRGGAQASERHLQAAAGLELLWLGIRFHDGISPRSPRRGGDEFVSGNAIVLASGDHLSAEAYRLFARLGSAFVARAARATEVLEGARLLVGRRGVYDIGDYVRACREAVGEIYGFGVGLAGLLRDEPAVDDGLVDLGRDLGVVLALVEDWEDLRRYGLRRPLVHWTHHSPLPHWATLLMANLGSLRARWSALAERASGGDEGAALELTVGLAAAPEARELVEQVLRGTLTNMAQRAERLGPTAQSIVELATDASARVSQP